MWMTLGIFFNWVQACTFGNCTTRDMVAVTSFSTIGGYDGLIGGKFFIFILTQIS